MNDQQSEEMVKQLKRIADSLERLSSPKHEETHPTEASGNPKDPELKK